MNELMVFNSPEFGDIRTLEEDGQVLFCGADVARALGYAKPQNALAAHCKGALKRGIPTNGGEQEMSFIPESDLYRLVFSSKLPTAEKFTDWVTEEVLPSIRKHGAYMTPDTLDSMIASPDFGIRLLTALKEEQEKRKALEDKTREDAPKVLFHDAVAASDGTILIRDLAKLLAQNGVPNMGGTRLFDWLRNNGYLCKEGKSRNLPTQRSIEMDLFRIRESVRILNGETFTDQTTRVTGKGQQYFIKKFLANRLQNGRA